MSRRTAWAVLAAAALALLWWFGSDGVDDASRDADSSSVASGTLDVPTPASTPTASPSASTAPSVEPSRSGASGPRLDEHGFEWITVSALPPEAREVLADIDAGGPYAYPGKDGSTFGNHEGVLPQQRRGYYREYTVPTPGLSHRGARRIVTGSRGERYWTADHYESFSRIRR